MQNHTNTTKKYYVKKMLIYNFVFSMISVQVHDDIAD